MSQDTRKDTRAPVSLKVRFKSATVDEFIEQYSIDISRGGIFIKSKSPMPVGTLLKFEFELKDNSPLIHGVGRVVWKRDADPGKPELAPGMGIKFIKMDPQSRGVVERIVAGKGTGAGFEEGLAAKSHSPSKPPAAPSSSALDEQMTTISKVPELMAQALASGAPADRNEIPEDQPTVARAQPDLVRQTRGATLDAVAEAAAEPARPAPVEPPAPTAAPPEPATAPSNGAAEAPVTATLQAPPSAAAPAATPPSAAAAAPHDENEAAAFEPDPPPPRVTVKPPTPAEARPATVQPAAQTPRRSESTARSWAVVVIVILLIIAGLFVLSRTREQPQRHRPASHRRERVEHVGTEHDAVPLKQPEKTGEGGATQAREHTAVIHVESSPTGAEVFWGEQSRGTTPADIRMPIGQPVTLRVVKAGYQERSQEVTPQEDAVPIILELALLDRVLSVTSIPEGAAIMVRGHRSGRTPKEIRIDAADGPIEVQIVHTGYQSFEQTIDPDEGWSVVGTEYRYRLSHTLVPIERPNPGRRTGTRRPPAEEHSGEAAVSQSEPPPATEPAPEAPPVLPPAPPGEPVPANPF